MPNIIKPDFQEALKETLEWEGGFVNHPNDPGGATNLGITKNVLEQWRGKSVSVQDVKDLTIEEAAKIYKKKYWDKVHADKILDHRVAKELFDTAVNTGPKQAVRILQDSINSFPQYSGENQLKRDGKIGAKTITATNDLITSGVGYALYREMNENQRKFYELIIERNPKFKVFKRGWFRRAKAEPRNYIEFKELPEELEHLKLSDEEVKTQIERIHQAKDNLNMI